MGTTLYSDDFRAGALLLLKAAGYPDTVGALETVARRLGVPRQTLSGWALKGAAPVPEHVMRARKLDFTDAIKLELGEIFEAMGQKRDKATYRDLTLSAGILLDKLQLLEGNATQNIQQTFTFVREGITTLHQPTIRDQTPPAITDRSGPE